MSTFNQIANYAEATLDELDAQMAQAQAALATALTAIDEWKATASGLSAEVAARDAQIARQVQQVDNLTARVAALTAERDALQTLLGELTQPGPKRYATLADAIADLNAPTDANYVMWNHGNSDLQAVLATLSANDILVLPERTEPYAVDSSKGFMAAGVSAVSATGGGKTPVVANARLWFAMARARRGIIGLGPGAVIEPSASAWTAPAQPSPQTVYYTNGTAGTLAGSQNAVIEVEHSSPFMANFAMRGRDFGGVSYSAIATRASAVVLSTWKRLHLDRAWRGFSGVPNGESAGIAISRGQYLIENCELNPAGLAPSPIMWNRTTGGTARNVKVGRPNYGMLTFWRCDGNNTFDNVDMDGQDQCLNLEEGGAAFVLNWTGGKLATQGQWHVIGESGGGSKRLAINDCTITGGTEPGSLCCHFYSYDSLSHQKKSDITRNNGPVYSAGSII